jgi:hypothetical protein
VSGDEEDRNLARNELFAGLSILACANGLGSRVIQATKRAGWTDAALGTFEISAIVFTACAAGVWLILRDSTDKIRSRRYCGAPSPHHSSYIIFRGIVYANQRGEPWSLTCGPDFVASWGLVRHTTPVLAVIAPALCDAEDLRERGVL